MYALMQVAKSILAPVVTRAGTVEFMIDFDRSDVLIKAVIRSLPDEKTARNIKEHDIRLYQSLIVSKTMNRKDKSGRLYQDFFFSITLISFILLTASVNLFAIFYCTLISKSSPCIFLLFGGGVLTLVCNVYMYKTFMDYRCEIFLSFILPLLTNLKTVSFTLSKGIYVVNYS